MQQPEISIHPLIGRLLYTSNFAVNSTNNGKNPLSVYVFFLNAGNQKNSLP